MSRVMPPPGLGIVINRFLAKVDRNGDCWLWLATGELDYGRFWLNGRYEQAHHVSYELFLGAVPRGMHVHHACRNTRCVRPDHLQLVTPAAHLHLGPTLQALNGAKTHCKHGHEFTPENTGPQTRNGQVVGRSCRACKREDAARRRLARKAA